MKIVINNCYGGFHLSNKAQALLDELKGSAVDVRTISRADEALVEVVKTLGSEEASGRFSELKVVGITNHATDWDILEYDGLETVVYVANGELHYVS